MKARAVKCRWPRVSQLSLKSLLLLVAVAGTLCGLFKWKLVRKERERAAVVAIEKTGSHAIYRWHWHANPKERTPPGPEWLRRRLGDDFFSDVVGVALRRESVTAEWLTNIEPLTDLEFATFTLTRVTDDGLRYLTRFKGIRRLTLDGTVTDAGLPYLKELPALKHLGLSGARGVTDAGMVEIAELRDLDELWLDATSVTDSGLAHLKHLSSLKRLWLRNTSITDAGLRHLRQMEALETLNLDATLVTDEGIASLHDLPALRELWVQDTPVTRSAADDLRRAVPGCKVHLDPRLRGS